MHQAGKHCVIEPLESRRLLSVVATDLNFGVQGKVVTDLRGDNSASHDFVDDGIVLGDGKLLLLATPDWAKADQNTFLIRYNADGTRDQSFAPGGSIQVPKQGSGRYLHIRALADGKLLLVGTATGSAASLTKILLVRLNADGGPDATFGADGIVTGPDVVASGVPDFVTGILPDGKIVAGYEGRKIWRFNRDGSLDTTFGNNGVVSYEYPNPSAIPYVREFFVNPDGSFYGATPVGETKFNADGTIDTAFATNGHLPPGNAFHLRQSDGKFIGFGVVSVGPSASDVVISRWNSNGTPDLGFGVNGSRQIDFGKLDTPGNIILDTSGRIVLGASTLTSPNNPFTSNDFALARLLPDGSLDDSFGVGGIFVDAFVKLPGNDALDVTINDQLQKVLLAPDGKIYAVGSSTLPSTEDPTLSNTNDNIAITRYVPDAPITISARPFAPVNEGAGFTASDSGSSYANGQITHYEWDFGSNGRLFVADAEGQTVQLQAGDSGSALVELRVTTSDGLQGMRAFAISVLNVSPVANAGPDRRVPVGVPIQLQLRFDDAVPELGKFTVDYGDGSALGVLNLTVEKNPQLVTVTHTYAQSGSYTLTLTADDGDGGISTDTATIGVGNIIANVFQDTNGQGTRNIDELPFSGRTVWVDVNDNGIQDPTEPASVTDSDGNALLSGLPAGTYKLRVQAPSGWQVSFSDPNFRGDYTTVTITATVGATAAIALTQRPNITGTVFNDVNGNGVRDAGEVGMNAVPIRATVLIGATASQTTSSNTASDGFYRVRGPLPGTYQVMVLPPTGWVQTFPDRLRLHVTDAQPGQTVQNIDFGIQQIAGATAGGLVFEDIDGDGANGASDRPYYPSNSPSDPPIYLDANNNGVRDLNERSIFISTIDGTWSSPGLPAGIYSFRALSRPGWVQTFPSDTGALTVTVAAGQSVNDLNFGLQKTDLVPPQATSFVFRHDVKPNRIEITFSEPVFSSDLLVLQPVGGARIPLDFNYDAITNTATYIPHDLAVLPDGNYVATLNSITRDPAGNRLAGQTELSFFVLKGDLNGDRSVSISDFITLASNFGKTNATYSDGDLNYDGAVTIADFIDLAANFNASLPPPSAAISPQAAAAESISPPIEKDDLLQIDASVRQQRRHQLAPDWHSHRRLHHRRAHLLRR